MIRVWVSAQTGAGMALLEQALSEFFMQDQVHGWICLTPEMGKIRASLYELGAVKQERNGEDGSFSVEILLSRQDFEQIMKRNQAHLDVLPLELRDEAAPHTMAASNA